MNKHFHGMNILRVSNWNIPICDNSTRQISGVCLQLNSKPPSKQIRKINFLVIVIKVTPVISHKIPHIASLKFVYSPNQLRQFGGKNGINLFVNF